MQNKNMMTKEDKQMQKGTREAIKFLAILGAIVVTGGAVGSAFMVHETGDGIGSGFVLGSIITAGILAISHSITND
ncbi:MAG: hypothetical protein J6Y85_04335 [Alphaproteobacteria bacterium]|nr:hypothetical protein [Alphaproteobacteria bacterium]